MVCFSPDLHVEELKRGILCYILKSALIGIAALGCIAISHSFAVAQAIGRPAGHATRTMRSTVRATQVFVGRVSFVSHHAASWSKALGAMVRHGWYLRVDAPKYKSGLQEALVRGCKNRATVRSGAVFISGPLCSASPLRTPARYGDVKITSLLT